MIIFLKPSISDLWSDSEYVSLNKYLSTCRVTLCYVLYDRYSASSLLSKIQTYSGIFTSYWDIFSHIVTYLEPWKTLAYSEPCHIQNPGIFRTQNIFRTLSRNILTYAECCVTLAYWEPCHIQNFGIFGTQDLFRILFI